MNELEEVQELVSYVCEENEKPAIEEIKNYVKEWNVWVNFSSVRIWQKNTADS